MGFHRSIVARKEGQIEIRIASMENIGRVRRGGEERWISSWRLPSVFPGSILIPKVKRSKSGSKQLSDSIVWTNRRVYTVF